MRQIKGTPEAIAYAKLLKEQGLTDTEIARRLNVSRTSIQCWTDDEWWQRRRELVNARRRKVRVFGPGIQGKGHPDGERSKPTLAHVPGIEGKSYSTTEIRLRNPRAPHAALKKPRTLYAAPLPKRLVHLGGGKVLFE